MTEKLTKAKLDYIPGLNGIRALSALLVISTHWPGNFLSLKFGWIGVNIFFVLSGFLITRILVAGKDTSLREFIGSFYYKRLLRIFPLYYGFLFFVSIAIIAFTYLIPSLLKDEVWYGGYATVKNDLIYYLTYTYNIKINLRYFFDFADSSNQFLGHLWSLAVEEQFYLVFPFIVYFCSIKQLKVVVISLLLFCPALRLWTAIWGVELVSDKYWLGELIYSNTLCQADALATGAALALFNFKIARPYLLFFSVAAIWLIVGIVNFYYLRHSGYFLVEGKSLGYNFPGFWFMQPTGIFLIDIRASYLYTLVNVLAAALILPATLDKPLFKKLFEFPLINYLGVISYGIYVFHNPLIALMLVILNNYGGIQIFSGQPVLEIGVFVGYLVIVITLSHISYKYFEKWFLQFKSRKVSLKKI